MNLIDTHAHIYMNEFQENEEMIFKNAAEVGVHTVLLPAVDSSSHQTLMALAAKHPHICRPMMGLHPCSVKENYEDELHIAEAFLHNNKFLAIGEIGLDFYWDISFAEAQHLAFRQQIEWALEFDLPVVIHSRNSIDECIAVVKEYRNKNLKGVFHCFSGNEEQANKIIELGFYLGIGGVLTFKNSGLDNAIKEIPMQWIVLETDAPYLAPVPFRGKRNQPSYIKYVAEKLAEIKKISIEEVADLTTENAKKIFKL